MTDYRFVMRLLMQQWSYRQIVQRAGCSHATVAKAKQICEDHGFETVADIEQLTACCASPLMALGQSLGVRMTD